MSDLSDQAKSNASNHFSPQCLILSPSHHLNSQLLSVTAKASQNSGLKSALYPFPIGIPPKNFYNPDILFTTIGSLKLKHGSTSSLRKILQNTKTIVFDEADLLFRMPSTRNIFKTIPKEIQKIFTGATLLQSESVLKFLKKHVPELQLHNFGNELDPIPLNIEQITLPYTSKKIDMLVQELLLQEEGKHLIFTNTLNSAKSLNSSLKSKLVQSNFQIFLFNGSSDYNSRLEILKEFKNCRTSCALVCTDLLSRGIDIPKINSVWNYENPENWIDYVHRIGRTGRMGGIGKTYSFLPPVG